jgi:hypothetical protein
MNKEIILIIAAILSIGFFYSSMVKLSRLKLSKSVKVIYVYLSILVPVLGWILISRHKAE